MMDDSKLTVVETIAAREGDLSTLGPAGDSELLSRFQIEERGGP